MPLTVKESLASSQAKKLQGFRHTRVLSGSPSVGREIVAAEISICRLRDEAHSRCLPSGDIESST
jgi:hypothetical protein